MSGHESSSEECSFTSMDDSLPQDFHPIGVHVLASTESIEEPALPDTSRSHHEEATPAVTSSASATPPVEQDVFNQQRRGMDAHQSQNNGDSEEGASQNPVPEIGEHAEEDDSEEAAMLRQALAEIEERIDTVQDRLLRNRQWQRIVQEHFPTMGSPTSPASESNGGYDAWTSDDDWQMLHQSEDDENQLADVHENPADPHFEVTANLASSTSSSEGETQQHESTSTGFRGRKRCSCGCSAPCNLTHSAPDVNDGASSSKAPALRIAETAAPGSPCFDLPPDNGGEEKDEENARFIANTIPCYSEDRQKEEPHHEACDPSDSMSDDN